MGECFFWYRPTLVDPDKGPLNNCVCVLERVRSIANKRVHVCSHVSIYEMFAEFSLRAACGRGSVLL